VWLYPYEVGKALCSWKKLGNHILALALYFMHYNFVRPHKSLANPYPRTPAMAAGISTNIWGVEEIIRLLG